MWMSLARRWIAVKIVESTRRMIGLMSLVSRSTVRLSSPLLVLAEQLHLEALGRLLEHPLRALALLEHRLDGRRRADRHLDRRAELQRDLVDQRQVGRIGDDDDERAAFAPVRHEAVAQHQLGRDRRGTAALSIWNVVHVDEVQPVALGQPPRLRDLGGELRRIRHRDASRRRAGLRVERLPVGIGRGRCHVASISCVRCSASPPTTAGTPACRAPAGSRR